MYAPSEAADAPEVSFLGKRQDITLRPPHIPSKTWFWQQPTESGKNQFKVRNKMRKTVCIVGRKSSSIQWIYNMDSSLANPILGWLISFVFDDAITKFDLTSDKSTHEYDLSRPTQHPTSVQGCALSTSEEGPELRLHNTNSKRIKYGGQCRTTRKQVLSAKALSNPDYHREGRIWWI